MPIVDPKVEIEFTAGTWTDVTADVDLTNGIAIKYGRTSEFSDAQTATCDFQLANHLGKYTPKAQLLADGTTAHPYYPNVAPRKRVRVSNTSGNRFLGYVKSWSPLLENGVRPFVAVSANDRQDQFSRINLKSFYEHELASTSPACSYLYSDTPQASGLAAVFLDSGPNNFPPLGQLGDTAFVPGAVDPMPQSDGLTGLSIDSSTSGGVSFVTSAVPLSAASFGMGGWLTIPILAASDPLNGTVAATFEVKNAPTLRSDVTAPPTSDVELAIYYGTQISLRVWLGSPLVNTDFITVFTGIADGKPHHYMMIATTAGATQTITFYVDGVSQGALPITSGQLATGYISSKFTTGTASASVVLGPMAAWATAPASTVPAQLTLAGNGRVGDTTGQRVTRLMQYLGLGSGEYSIDAGLEILSGAQPIRGKSVVSACQDVATTEGDGSTFYFNTDGLARFCDRTFRKPATPNLTLSAALDLDGAFAPTFDDMTLVNQSAVTRGGGNTLTYTDTASSTANGLTTDSATSYASTDAAALALAQQRVSSQSTPGVRLPQFSVDLSTSSVAASAFAGMQIGWRARINTLPVGVNSLSQVDVIIEGWAETITKTSWVLTFDASPADNPARFVWGDAKYGRWGPGATMTLTSSVTAAATSISVTTSAGNPTFTLVAGAYPLPIKIGEEEMTITTAPGSSASPQTLTVTRGTSGTRAAPQTAGARVSLSPSPTWTL